MTGKLESFEINPDGTSYFIISSRAVNADEYEILTGCDVEFSLKKYHPKRSLEANRYMWELCTKIADKLSDDGELYSKEEIYRDAIRNYGVFDDHPMLYDGVEMIRELWKSKGIGWFTEIVDSLPDGDGYLVRCYHGSSEYNRKQMSRIINSLIQDCDALGIEHKTPAEIANMLSLWQQAKDKERN